MRSRGEHSWLSDRSPGSEPATLEDSRVPVIERDGLARVPDGRTVSSARESPLSSPAGPLVTERSNVDRARAPHRCAMSSETALCAVGGCTAGQLETLNRPKSYPKPINDLAGSR